jgi:hypothetical protein
MDRHLSVGPIDFGIVGAGLDDGVFRAVVEPTANLVTVGIADLFHRCGIRAKPVSDDALGSAIFLHDALQKLERRSLVPLRGHHRFQNLAFVIDSPPEIAELAVDLHKHLIQMPPPLGEVAQMRNPLLSDLCREHQAEPVPPKSDGLMADVDPALRQEILDVSQRQWVPHGHHYDETDYFWRAVEISEWAAHGPELPRSEAARRIALTPPIRTRAPRLSQIAKLFDGHRLGEIARLIDVGSQDKRGVVRKKLQRQREDQRCY